MDIDRVIAGTTGAFGVPGENSNRRIVAELCAKRMLCVCNMYFEDKS